jgi:hypothetical protein
MDENQYFITEFKVPKNCILFFLLLLSLKDFWIKKTGRILKSFLKKNFLFFYLFFASKTFSQSEEIYKLFCQPKKKIR